MTCKKILPLLLAALFVWTASASAAPQTTLKIAVGDPEDSEMGVVGNAFKKYVEEKSGGKVEVQCFYGGRKRMLPQRAEGPPASGHGRHRQPRAL